MKIALDTNVLVRYLIWDDRVQAELAADFIENSQLVYASTVMLCETVWVLRRLYKLSVDEIGRMLQLFISAENVEVDSVAVVAGLAQMARGGDFADGVILHEARLAKVDEFVTFDRALAGLGIARVI